MKTGKTIQEFAAEIARQNETRHDYRAPTSALRMKVADDGGLAMTLGEDRTLGVGEVAHDQIALHADIPRKYYDRMRRERPDLLATNVNEWFGANKEGRLVRELDGRVRALLSPSYKPLDNIDLARAILPAIAERKLEVMSCEITEKRLYIKAVDTQLFRDVPVGHKMGDGTHTIFDTCAPAFIASNSEVGYGRLVLDTGVYTRACTNMTLFSDGGMKRTHLGARSRVTDVVENIDHLLSDQTRRKTDEALWLQLRDVVAAAFDVKRLGERVARLAASAQNKIEGKVEKVVEVAGEKFGLGEDERSSVLRHLIEGGSLTQYGLHAAVTRAAQDADDYDRATELEYLGGRIVELKQTEWQELAAAA